MESWAIDVLAYDGCFAAEAYGLVDLLGVANHVADALRPGAPPLFRTRIVSITGSVRPSGSGELRTDLVGPVPPNGELVVPGFMCVDPTTAVDRVTALPAEVGYLREVAGTRVSAICGGSFCWRRRACSTVAPRRHHGCSHRSSPGATRMSTCRRPR